MDGPLAPRDNPAMELPISASRCAATSGVVLLLGFCAIAACGRSGLPQTSPAARGGSTGDVRGIEETDAVGAIDTGGSGPAVGSSLGSDGSSELGGGETGGDNSGGDRGSGGLLGTGGARATGGTTSDPGSGGRLGSGGMTGSGGRVATGGSASGGSGGGSCSDAVPCGGDPVGTWNVTSSCLSLSGPLDMTMAGVACTASVVGTLQVTGSWIGKSNGAYADYTTTVGAEQVDLPPPCMLISGTVVACEQIGGLFTSFHYVSDPCSWLAGGSCSCYARAYQGGWPGLLSWDSATSGKYTTSGNTLTLDGEARYAYCVSGNQMTWIPQSENPRITGAIVFQRAADGK
jgi:hypothetical protein